MGDASEIYGQQMEELMGGGIFSMLLTDIPSALISIATYVFTALALYTIAKRRGIHKPWLAWLPIVNVYTLGCIADQYRQVAKGEVRCRRKTLLGLNIAMSAMSILLCVLAIIMLVGIFSFGLDMLMDEVYMDMHAEELISAVAGPLVGILLLCLPMMVVSIIYMVFYYISLHDLYKSCDPGNATLYLLLSIFISITLPIFLFICRDKDGGMPARQTQEPQYIPAEPWEQTQA